jgi:hypothetical protein
VILSWRQGKRVELYRQKGPIALEPGQSQAVPLTYELGSDREPALLKLAVQDAETGKVCADRQLEQQVLPAMKLSLKPRLYYLGDKYGQLEVDFNLATGPHAPALLLALFSERTGRLVRAENLRVSNDRLNAGLDFSGLPAGAYRFEAALKSGSRGSGRRLATEKVTITKVAGPFDE